MPQPNLTNVEEPSPDEVNKLNFLCKRPHLSRDERMDIIDRLKKNECGAKIARDYGITKQAVSAIKRRAQLMGCSFDDYNSNYYVALNNNTYAPLSSQLVKLNGTDGQSNKSKISEEIELQKRNKIKSSLSVSSKDLSHLVLPVNPVAIIKSKLAKKNGDESVPSISSRSSTPNNSSPSSVKSSNNSSTNLQRLILPKLLQGNTDQYKPSVYTVNSSSSQLSKPRICLKIKKTVLPTTESPNTSTTDDQASEPVVNSEDSCVLQIKEEPQDDDVQCLSPLISTMQNSTDLKLDQPTDGCAELEVPDVASAKSESSDDESSSESDANEDQYAVNELAEDDEFFDQIVQQTSNEDENNNVENADVEESIVDETVSYQIVKNIDDSDNVEEEEVNQMEMIDENGTDPLA